MCIHVCLYARFWYQYRFQKRTKSHCVAKDKISTTMGLCKVQYGGLYCKSSETLDEKGQDELLGDLWVKTWLDPPIQFGTEDSSEVSCVIRWHDLRVEALTSMSCCPFLPTMLREKRSVWGECHQCRSGTIKYRRGPSTEPCGTPVENLCMSWLLRPYPQVTSSPPLVYH